MFINWLESSIKAIINKSSDLDFVLYYLGLDFYNFPYNIPTIVISTIIGIYKTIIMNIF